MDDLFVKNIERLRPAGIDNRFHRTGEVGLRCPLYRVTEREKGWLLDWRQPVLCSRMVTYLKDGAKPRRTLQQVSRWYLRQTPGPLRCLAGRTASRRSPTCLSASIQMDCRP